MILDNLGLRDWFNSLTATERDVVVQKCEIINADTYNAPASLFLADCLSWLNTKENYPLCLKFAQKSEELLPAVKNAADLHFVYMHLIKFYYKNRDSDNCNEKAIEYCNKQISISKSVINSFDIKPAHTGYEQLAIIEKKNKNWNRVIELCKNAKSEGWGGDWDKRIEEAEKKLSRPNAVFSSGL